jgi:hypothetical protein
LQVGDTGPVESARRSNSRVLGSPFSGLSGHTDIDKHNMYLCLKHKYLKKSEDHQKADFFFSAAEFLRRPSWPESSAKSWQHW